MNLVNYTKTPVFRVFETIKSEAARYGVNVTSSEIIGLVPNDAIVDIADFYMRFEGFSKEQILIIPEATKKGYAEIENGECFDMLHPKSKTRRGRKMKDKSNCLTIVQPEFYRYEIARIRRLTPLECCRLQTIPEAETEKILSSGVSDSQIYKMLGNGWTVAVIAYILKHL